MHVHGRWLYGVWCLGNNYRGSGYYGAFPPGLLKRIWALFGDVRGPIMHLCSGSLTKMQVRRRSQLVVRVDFQRKRRVRPTVRGDAQRLPFCDRSFDLKIADPPYGALQAKHYGIPMPNRRLMVQEAARTLKPGGCLVWLDTVWPMFRKVEWRCFGHIAIIRSTNHVVRLVSLFERQ